MTTHQSQQWLQRGLSVLPGGVNSPVRAFRAVGGEPLFIRRASGAYLEDVDGRRYIDFVGSWGPALLGHGESSVVAAVQAAAAEGLSFGAPTAREVEFAEEVCRRYPSMEMLRCVSSGTEATMSALRVARGFTGRSLLVKFDGCYHGHADSFLVQAGSGLATFGAPDSAGVPEAVARETASLPYNDVARLREFFERRGSEVAAVIVEPVVGNMGCVPPDPGFLEAMIELCRQYGAVSIFDEVMTGCRLAPGGAQELYGLRPDLTCLGKVVGGGLPLAVYGGARRFMELVAPLGPVYQAGTLSGNPLATAAGLATLRLLTPERYEALERNGARLELAVRGAIAELDAPVCFQRVGSMFTLFFRPGPVRNWTDADGSSRTRFAKFHEALLAEGVYWPPSQFEAAFLSLAHGEDELAVASRAIAKALAVAVSSC